MKKILLANLFACFCLLAISQEIAVYPTHWWPGMKNPNVQLMVHSEKIGDRLPMLKIAATGIRIADGITLKKIHRVENPNYVFLDLVIDKAAKPGKRVLNFGTGSAKTSIDFELKVRRTGKGVTYAQGVTSEDMIYMLMPDRFANGDESNDRLAGMRDQSLNRDSIFHRHGGDLQGLTANLDYLHDLGVTAIWPTPLIENDMPSRSEHGYAATNHYRIEPRFGGEKALHEFTSELHKRKMKFVQDIVYNHIGRYHHTFLDMPMKDWVNQWPQFTKTNHREQPVFDPYASKHDKNMTLNGWFEPMMPDLNHRNPYVANYIIQHCIFSIEEFGVDGFRIDTYKYNDLDFMNRCNQAVYDEYPKFTIFGEAWVGNVPAQAYFTENNINLPWKSNLHGAVDFQALFEGISPAMNEKDGWSNGVNKLYSTLSQDFLYKNPMNNVLILDNHDMTRWYSTVGEDINKMKTGIAWLMTCRGIPQFYYGTEIGMKGISNPDGWVRLDFKGGWKGDKENKFSEAGRNKEENEIFNWTRSLANFRKNSSAIKTGKMMQYLPQDGLYVYFRYDDKQTVMCVMNASEKEMTVDFSKYADGIKDFTKARSVTNDQEFSLKSTWPLGAKQIWVLELGK
ncbi:alpha-amylase family glycosyl hydrolase [Aridibaculum aurantiacum]|uniref:alpha-amylase family glycosyl hydrolase n=1 Tax=Aridibaculum aurantiacum TaxID=2810307 RepID=UPI001A9566AC|nr:alpha-amylase family glycosyl hydrolase [Aridibaculum aurantiacum]